MNKKKCFLILSEFLGQVEDKYKLQKGDYRISFYVKANTTTVCYSIINATKVPINVSCCTFLYTKNNRVVISNYDFKIHEFVLFYFEGNLLNKYNTLKISQQIKALTGALNDVYLDQAIIPIQLL